MRRRLLLALAVLVISAPSIPATATFPYPPLAGDPYDYTRFRITNGSCDNLPAGQPRPPGTDLPPTFDCRRDWEMTSYAAKPGEPDYDPLVANNPQEFLGVKGASVNRAWEVTTGRPDTTIAVMDSGIRWNTRHLANKVRLSIGELPLPCGGPVTCNDARGAGTYQEYDFNGDGVFNVVDFASDARVSARNGSYLTPDDLIHRFSDAADDDGNGYADDIAGWDFFQRDNDAFDDTDYGHGTGEASDSSAEIDLHLTVCPNCMFIPLRVGDSFIAEINRFAEGVVYSVDNGVDVIQEALGTLNHTAFAQAAADYAYRNGVLIVASEADESAGHHNYPAALNHTMVVNSVTRFVNEGTGDFPAPFNSAAVQNPKTYLAFNGCTNFGGYTWVTVAAASCSSGATGNASGMAGLLYSAARNAVERGLISPSPTGRPISAEEAKQLFRLGAEDVDFGTPKAPFGPPLNFGTTLPASQRFITTEGWDQISGFGRINADKLLRMIEAGQIPPEADIISPRWWEPITTTGTIDVVGRVAAPRAESYTYEVQWTPGVQPPRWPAKDTWHTAADGSGTSPQQGVLAEIDMADVRAAIATAIPAYTPADDPTSRDLPEKNAFRIRVIVRDPSGLEAIEQRQAFVLDDPSLVAGFPLSLGDADGAGSPVFADLDGDGSTELVLSDGNGFVHAYRSAGGELPGFPVHTDLFPLPASGDNAYTREHVSPAVYTPILLGSPAIADIDNDGDNEISAADTEGRLYVWNHDGTLRWKRGVNLAWSTNPPCNEPGNAPNCDEFSAHPVRDRINTVDRMFSAAPAFGDLDRSFPGLEVVIGSWDGHVYAWHADGSAVPGWPVLLRDPDKVASIDPVSHRVTFKPGRVFYGRQVLAGVTLGDITGDGDIEVLANVNEEYEEQPNFTPRDPSMLAVSALTGNANTRTYAIWSDGTNHPGTPKNSVLQDNAYVPGWPVKIGYLTPELLPDVGAGSDGAPVIGEIDGKTVIATASVAGPVYLLNPNGTSFYGNGPDGKYITMGSLPAEFKNPTATDGSSVASLGGAVFGRLGGPLSPLSVAMGSTGLRRLLDVVLPEQQLGAEDHISAWDARTGTFMPGFPSQMNDLMFFNTPAIADVSGDGLADVLQTSAMYDLQAYTLGGARPLGFPKFTGGWSVSTPAIGDFDGDGRVEVATVTREGWLFVWHTAGSACQTPEWPKYQHDLRNSGDGRAPAEIAGSC